MSDVVNTFFRKFYPADYQDWRPGSVGRAYTGPRDATIFPLMVCADGFTMSVQGHHGAYSEPRDDFAEEYTRVEVYCVSEPEPLLNDHQNSRNRGFGLPATEARAGMDEPIAGVPIAVVEAVIAKHGGLVESAP